MHIIIHHLHTSASERIVWLCEELSIPYDLETYRRSPLFAPPEYKSLHPAGTAPVIQRGSVTLAETCACIEYLSHKHGEGKLFLSPAHPLYVDFLYWWHWANGTFQPVLTQLMILGRHEGFNIKDLQKRTDVSNLVLTSSRDRFKSGVGNAER